MLALSERFLDFCRSINLQISCNYLQSVNFFDFFREDYQKRCL